MKNYINVNASASGRFNIGDSVEWVSKSGNQYTGEIVAIREDRSEDLYQRGALVTVQIEGGAYRNFYENQVDHHVLESSL
jgi:hypothetical protein